MTDKPERKDYPPYLDCPRPRVPMTNGDKIRAMTDEGLVEFMCELIGVDCACCPVFDRKKMDCRLPDWLKREAKE